MLLHKLTLKQIRATIISFRAEHCENVRSIYHAYPSIIPCMNSRHYQKFDLFFGENCSNWSINKYNLSQQPMKLQINIIRSKIIRFLTRMMMDLYYFLDSKILTDYLTEYLIRGSHIVMWHHYANYVNIRLTASLEWQQVALAISLCYNENYRIQVSIILFIYTDNW